MVRVFFIGGPVDGHHLQYPVDAVGEGADIILDEALLVSSQVLRQVARCLVTGEALSPTVYQWESTSVVNDETRMVYVVRPRNSGGFLAEV